MTLLAEKTLFLNSSFSVAKTNKFLKVKVKSGRQNITLDVEFNSLVVKAVVFMQTLLK